MEQQTYRPSKQFIIRASIGLGILSIAFIVQSSWFRNLFRAKDSVEITKTDTIENIIDKDSNGNTIPDWEERLWGLDPTTLYTNGVSNKEIIEQKKRSLGVGENPTEEINDTDRLARELFVLTTALGQSEEVDRETLKKIGEKLGQSVNLDQVSNHYSFKSIRPATTTRVALETYYSNLNRITEKYDENAADIDIIIDGLETGNFSRLPELKKAETNYKNLANELATIRVPLGVTGYHLNIINGLYGMAESFSYLQELEENAVQGITGISIYKKFALQFQVALVDMSNYLGQYGIL